MDQTHLRFLPGKRLFHYLKPLSYEVKRIEAIRVDHPSYHKAIASLHEVCVQLGIRHDFMTEASAYQYVIEAERSM